MGFRGEWVSGANGFQGRIGFRGEWVSQGVSGASGFQNRVNEVSGRMGFRANGFQGEWVSGRMGFRVNGFQGE